MVHCQAIGLLHLPEDLGLSHDEGIETGGDPKEMADGIAVTIYIQTSGHIFFPEVSVAEDQGL
jgi:hypothetical protein